MYTGPIGAVLAIQVADCAPVALWSPEGVLGAAHAGWRGLADGVLPATAEAMRLVERERTSRKVRAAGILQQFEVEMGLAKPVAAPQSTSAPSVGGRVGEKQGS